MKRPGLIIISLIAVFLIFWFFFKNGQQESSTTSLIPSIEATRPPDQTAAPEKILTGTTQSPVYSSKVPAAHQPNSTGSFAPERSKNFVEPPDEPVHTAGKKLSTSNKKNTRQVQAGGEPQPAGGYDQQAVVEKMFGAVHEAERTQNREQAFETLLAMKEIAQGEDLQSVLKKLHEYAEYGANEAILDVFLSSRTLPEVERFRMLSYINPEYLLEPDSVELLNNEYDQVEENGLRHSIIQTVAAAGGDTGVKLLVDRAERTEEYDEWKMLIDALGRSQTESGFIYLNGLLDDLAHDTTTTEAEMEAVRQAIQSF